MASPILRLATRTTPRTRTTAWAIAFACMVLVGALALMDGLRAGADSVGGRLVTGPAVYIDGPELLESRIPADRLSPLAIDFDVLRVHPGRLSLNGSVVDVVVASAERHRNGSVLVDYPFGAQDLALDAGLRARIQQETGAPPGATAGLTLFDVTLEDLPVVAPPPVRAEVFPSTWVWVRPQLLLAMDPAEGSPAQAIVTDLAMDPSVAASLGLSRLEVLGAVGFLRGSVDQAAAALSTLAVLIGVVIGLLAYSAMSLEVHQRTAEIRTLRSLGATPRTVAAIYEGQALTLSLLGATLGSALGIALAHGIVTVAPLLGFPNLVLLRLPVEPTLLVYAVALLAGAIGGLVPSRQAARASRRVREVGPS